MAIFHLGCSVTVSAYTLVEAGTLEEAIELSSGRMTVIGGINSDESEEESWIIEEADGTPEDIHSTDP